MQKTYNHEMGHYSNIKSYVTKIVGDFFITKDNYKLNNLMPTYDECNRV